MTKYRYLINLGLFIAQVVPTLYLIYYIVTTFGKPDIEVMINFIFISVLGVMLFKNKNFFNQASDM
jgi:hypothetical protein